MNRQTHGHKENNTYTYLSLKYFHTKMVIQKKQKSEKVYKKRKNIENLGGKLYSCNNLARAASTPSTTFCISLNILTDWYMDRRIVGHMDTQTHKWMDRQSDRHAHRYTDRWKDGENNRWTNVQRDRQTVRQSDSWTDRKMDKLFTATKKKKSQKTFHAFYISHWHLFKQAKY